MSGTYWSDELNPIAPCSIASATSAVIFASSAGVARRSALPMTTFRTPPAPTNVPMFNAGLARSSRAKYCSSVVQSGHTL